MDDYYRCHPYMDWSVFTMNKQDLQTVLDALKYLSKKDTYFDGVIAIIQSELDKPEPEPEPEPDYWVSQQHGELLIAYGYEGEPKDQAYKWRKVFTRPQSADKPEDAPVLYQYRDISEGVPTSDWKDVKPRNIHTDTVQDRIRELLAYQYKGQTCYEVRALYTRPQSCECCNKAELDKPDEPVERTAWLIEIVAGPMATAWLCAPDMVSGWTKDANAAIGFPNREVAINVFNHLMQPPRWRSLGLDRSCYKITEHIFVTKQPEKKND
jgi:hypothetical protein